MEYIRGVLTNIFKETMDFLERSEQFSQITKIAVKIIVVIVVARFTIKLINSVID